jgi:hypothetical protein
MLLMQEQIANLIEQITKNGTPKPEKIRRYRNWDPS